MGLNLDPGKLLVILLVAFIVLGPERLPKLARQLGSAWRTMTNLREQVTEEVRRAIPELGDLPRMPQRGMVRRYVSDLTRPLTTDAASGNRASSGSGERTTAPTGARATAESLDWGDDPGMN